MPHLFPTQPMPAKKAVTLEKTTKDPYPLPGANILEFLQLSEATKLR